jgi:hypothetical protein
MIQTLTIPFLKASRADENVSWYANEAAAKSNIINAKKAPSRAV